MFPLWVCVCACISAHEGNSSALVCLLILTGVHLGTSCCVLAFVCAKPLCMCVRVCEHLDTWLKKNRRRLRLFYCCQDILLIVCKAHLHVIACGTGSVGGYWLFGGLTTRQNVAEKTPTKAIRSPPHTHTQTCLLQTDCWGTELRRV